MKTTLRFAICMCLCLASMAIGQGPPMYTVTVADPGLAPFSVGRGINDKGDSVSRSFDPTVMTGTADIAAKRRKQGQFSVLAPLPGYSASGPNNINNRGDVVGFSSNAATDSTATLWKKNGQIVDLGTLPGWPAAIANYNSDSGYVVGIATTDISINADGVPFRWNKGTMSQITHPAYQFGAATGVNSKGTVAGNMWNVLGPGSDVAGFIADKFDNVAILPPLAGGTFTELRDINNNGIAVGHADSAAGLALGAFEHGIIYDTKTGAITPVYPPAGFQLAFLGRINDAGTAVAIIVNVMVPMPQADWAVYTEGQLWDLSTLVVQDAGSFWLIIDARDINSKGQISGTAVDLASAAPAPVAVVVNPVN